MELIFTPGQSATTTGHSKKHHLFGVSECDLFRRNVPTRIFVTFAPALEMNLNNI